MCRKRELTWNHQTCEAEHRATAAVQAARARRRVQRRRGRRKREQRRTPPFFLVRGLDLREGKQLQETYANGFGRRHFIFDRGSWIHADRASRDGGKKKTRGLCRSAKWPNSLPDLGNDFANDWETLGFLRQIGVQTCRWLSKRIN